MEEQVVAEGAGHGHGWEDSVKRELELAQQQVEEEMFGSKYVEEHWDTQEAGGVRRQQLEAEHGSSGEDGAQGEPWGQMGREDLWSAIKDTVQGDAAAEAGVPRRRAAEQGQGEGTGSSQEDYAGGPVERGYAKVVGPEVEASVRRWVKSVADAMAQGQDDDEVVAALKPKSVGGGSKHSEGTAGAGAEHRELRSGEGAHQHGGEGGRALRVQEGDAPVDHLHGLPQEALGSYRSVPLVIGQHHNHHNHHEEGGAAGHAGTAGGDAEGHHRHKRRVLRDESVRYKFKLARHDGVHEDLI